MTSAKRFFVSLLPFLALALFPTLLLWRIVFLGEAFVPADLLRDIAPWRDPNPNTLVPWNPLMWDGVAEFYPWRSFFSATVHQGFLPFWNPHQFCGTPFAANSQSAIFYPLNLLFVLLPVAAAFGASVWLHLCLTGIFLYLFLRSNTFGLSRSAALFGAVAWQLCTWQISWLALPTFLCVSTWLPLGLLLIDRLLQRLTLSRAAALAWCLGVMLLAGHLQVFVYCALLIVAFALFQVIPVWRNRSRERMRIAGCALATALLAGLIATPQLLPAIELSHISHRVTSATWENYHAYTRLALSPIHLIMLFFPDFYGNPTLDTYWNLTNYATNYAENACYVGIATLLFAMFGVFATWKQSRETKFFGLAALISLLLALGTPLNALLYFGIPGFASSGSPGRILVLWSFCAPVLAAIGVQAALKRSQQSVMRSWIAASASFIGLAILIFAYIIWWVDSNHSGELLKTNLSNETNLWRLPFGILLAAGLLLAQHKRGKLSSRLAGGVLVMLVGMDLLAGGLVYNRSAAPRNIYPVTPIIAYLQQQGDTFRVMPLNKSWSLDPNDPPHAILPPNGATAYGLNDTQGYDSLFAGQYMAFAANMNGDGEAAPQANGNMVFTRGYLSPEAQEASARYILSRKPLPPSPSITLIKDGEAYLYENKLAKPRFEFKNGSIASVGSANPNRLQFGLRGESESNTLVVRDQWYPGWRASAGGASIPIEPRPFIFRTIRWHGPQAAGVATYVEMHYEPTAIRLGLFLLCLAGAITTSAITYARLVARTRP